MVSKITQDKKRNKTLRRRRGVLLKKAGELSVLCDVPVCLVAYCPGEAEPVVWPSPAVAEQVVRRYRDQPKVDNSRKDLDSTEFVKEINDKLKAKISNVQLQRHEAEIKNVVVDYLAGRRGNFDDLPTDFFISMGTKVQEKLQAVNARLEQIRSARAPAPALLPAPEEDVQMAEPVATVAPPLQPSATPVPQTPMMIDPFGDALASTEEMHAAFVNAGIF